MELLPLILVGFTIARMVGTGQLNLAIAVTGAALLLVMLLTMLFVKEEPLKTKPDTPLWPPMLRVLGMLVGIILGAAAGLLGGVIVGALAGLLSWAWAGKDAALAFAVGLGGVAAMIIAVIAGAEPAQLNLRLTARWPVDFPCRLASRTAPTAI